MNLKLFQPTIVIKLIVQVNMGKYLFLQFECFSGLRVSDADIAAPVSRLSPAQPYKLGSPFHHLWPHEGVTLVMTLLNTLQWPQMVITRQAMRENLTLSIF